MGRGRRENISSGGNAYYVFAKSVGGSPTEYDKLIRKYLKGVKTFSFHKNK